MSKSKIVTCAWCKKQFEKAIKRINESEKLGQQHTCSRACSSKLANEPRKCEPTTDNAANTRRDKEKFPEKNSARSLVRQAIKSGKIIPIEECELCGAEGAIEAHHPDHDRPFLLLFLCKSCHAQADASIDKYENLATDYSECV